MKIPSAAMSCVQTNIQTDVVYMLYKTGSPQFLIRPKINCRSESSGSEAVRRYRPPPTCCQATKYLSASKSVNFKLQGKHETFNRMGEERTHSWRWTSWCLGERGVLIYGFHFRLVDCSFIICVKAHFPQPKEVINIVRHIWDSEDFTRSLM